MDVPSAAQNEWPLEGPVLFLVVKKEEMGHQNDEGETCGKRSGDSVLGTVSMEGAGEGLWEVTGRGRRQPCEPL